MYRGLGSATQEGARRIYPPPSRGFDHRRVTLGRAFLVLVPYPVEAGLVHRWLSGDSHAASGMDGAPRPASLLQTTPMTAAALRVCVVRRKYNSKMRSVDLQFFESFNPKI